MSTFDLYVSGFTSPNYNAVVRDNNYVYFANNNNKIGRVSVTDPTNINLDWATITTLTQINCMAIYGTTIYCSQELAISNKYYLIQVNTTNATYSTYSSYEASTTNYGLVGFRFITCDKNGTIYVGQSNSAYDSGIIYKLQPGGIYRAWINAGNYSLVQALTYYENYIYAHVDNIYISYDGIHRYPITTPNGSSGQSISTSPFFPQTKMPSFNGYSFGLAAYNNYLYFTLANINYIFQINIATPTVYTSNFANGGTGINSGPVLICTSTNDNYMFIGTGSAIGKIALKPVASSLYYSFAGTTTSLQLYNKYLYTHTGNNIIRLHKTNTTDVSLNWYSLPFQHNTTIYNGYIYSVSPTTITIINIRNKTTSTIGISLANTTQTIFSACVNYPYIYFSNDTYIARVNLTTQTDVNYNWCSLGFTAYTMTIYNNYLYAGKSNTNPIQKIDISNPTTITTFVATNATANDYKGFSVYNNYLYVSLQTTGVITRYLLSNSTTNDNPYANFITNPSPTGTAASYDGRLFVSGSSGNIYTISIPSFVTSTVYSPTLIQSNTIVYGSGNINVAFTDISNNPTNDINYVYYLFDPSGVNQYANISYYTDTGIPLVTNSEQNSFLLSGLTTKTYTIYLRAVNELNYSSNTSPYSVSVLTTPSSPNSYSLSFDEATGITVSITDTRNVAVNKVYYYYYYYRVGDTATNQSADINVYANSYVPVVNGQTSYSFNITGLQTSYYNVYIAAKNSVGGNIYSPSISPVNVICFKEDSRILTNRGYRKIQYLRKGDLIKTFKDGFKPIYKIGKKEITHVPSLEKRTKDQLYKCSHREYPEVFEDLILTGCHSILVDEFANDEERTQTQKINGGIYVTDTKYRLPVCVDHRASVYEHAGKYVVYHIALENDDNYMNYGIYANGLLVESTSKRFLDEYKVMDAHNKIYTS